MSENGEDGKETLKKLTLAITLLAGISAVLIKLIDYSDRNILDGTISVLILFFVMFLILEIVMLVLFLLTTAYSIWPLNKDRINRLKDLREFFGFMMFFIPISTIIWIIFVVTFTFLTEDTDLSITTIRLFTVFIMIVPFIISLYLGGLDFGYLKDIMQRIQKIVSQNSLSTSFKMIKGGLTIIVCMCIISALIVCLLQASIFLLCGAYSIEVNHLPGVDTDVMSLTIKDTGIPSGKCDISLIEVDDSNSGLFQQIDNVTLQVLEDESSKYKYMSGKKEYGMYYLFIDTANLSHGYYLLHAETSYHKSDGFNLFEPKKEDNELFYLPPRNKT